MKRLPRVAVLAVFAVFAVLAGPLACAPSSDRRRADQASGEGSLDAGPPGGGDAPQVFAAPDSGHDPGARVPDAAAPGEAGAAPGASADVRPTASADTRAADAPRPAPPPGDAAAAPSACGPRWPGTSDACWSCLCDTCPAETAACGSGCWSVVTCMGEKGCFTGEVVSETLCLLFACGGPLGMAPKVGDWDGCLLKKGTGFPRRACDDVCGIPTHATKP